MQVQIEFIYSVKLSCYELVSMLFSQCVTYAALFVNTKHEATYMLTYILLLLVSTLHSMTCSLTNAVHYVFTIILQLIIPQNAKAYYHQQYSFSIVDMTEHVYVTRYRL